MSNLQRHIKLKEVDKICLISGNPDRVSIIASYLHNSEKVAEYRGLVSYKGVTPRNRIPVTVLTTGMGSGSSAIVLEEACRAGGKIFIRIGSTGSLQLGKNYGIGTIFIPHAAIRNERTSTNFIPLEFPATADPDLYNSLCTSAKNLQIEFITGIVWSTDVYYYPHSNQYKKWAKFGAVCVEMESSTLFIFSSMKGKDVKAATILTSDGNLNDGSNIYTGNVEDSNKQFQDGVHKTIHCVISAIDNGL